MRNTRVHLRHSLKTQLFAGALLLLGVTISVVGYSLIVQQGRALTVEMERTVVLQGRNIALSSAKPLLRDDPEFELYPLVTRMLKDVAQITGVVIVDAEGVIQGHRELVQVSRRYEPLLEGYVPVSSPLLASGERLYEDAWTYLFVTPVVSADRTVGAVHLTYSRQELVAGIRQAVRLTLTLSGGALILGSVLALLFFRHISRSMGVMMEGVDALAAGNMEARIDMPTRNEFRVLARAFNDMSDRIRDSQRELVAKERVDRELEIAAEVQKALLPASMSPPDGFEIGHFYQAATEVGGDYIDVIAAPEGRRGVVMADVSGKGVPGLVVMAMVKIMAQQLFRTTSPPVEILKRLNTALHSNMRKNMFVTMFVGLLDAQERKLRFSNAGHNPLLVYNHDGGTARLVKMEGVPLGAFPSDFFDARAREYELDLKPGDLVLQYTDGLSESRTAGGRMFGLERIRDLATLYGKYGARTLVEKLVVEETRFRDGAPRKDDITMLALGAVAPVRESLEEPVIS